MTRVRDPLAKKRVGRGSNTSGRSITKVSRHQKATSKKQAPAKKAEGKEVESIFKFDENDPVVDKGKEVKVGKRLPSKNNHDTQNKKAVETTPSLSKVKDTLPTAKTEPKLHQALGVDTRCIDDIEFENATTSVLDECSNFVSSLVRQGLAPTILASTENLEPKSAKKTARAKKTVLGIRARRLTNDITINSESENRDKILSLATARLKAKAVKRNNEDAIDLPSDLLARSSWKLFGDFGK